LPEQNSKGGIAVIPEDARKMFHWATDPLFHEFKLKDVLELIVGASILAVPVGFTEETWRLGQTLPMLNTFGLLLISLFFISLFTYYNYYRNKKHSPRTPLIARVAATYALSCAVVAALLTLIQVAPWTTDWVVAFKRIILVALPASMSAVVADTIK